MVLGHYLEGLDEELVTLTREQDSALGVGELEEKAQPAEGQTEVGEQDFKVRQLFFSHCPELWCR